MKEWQAVLVIIGLFVLGCIFGLGAGLTYPWNSIHLDTILELETKSFKPDETKPFSTHIELVFSDTDGHVYGIFHPSEELLQSMRKRPGYVKQVSHDFVSKDDINLIEKSIIIEETDNEGSSIKR